MIEITYTEIDGLLYPNIETGLENIEASLNKYGLQRLRDLHEHKPERYRELLLTGKLAQYCKAIDIAAFEQSEQIQGALVRYSSHATRRHAGSHPAAHAGADDSR